MWIVLALLAALSSAIVVVLSKAGMKNLDPTLAFAVQSILIIIIAWSMVFIEGKQAELAKIDGRTWTYLVIAGVVTTVSSLLSFKALKLGEAGSVSPLTSLSLVFAIVFAALFLKERISWQLVVGALLMAAGAVIIALAKRAG